jgi:O6-methylguanine-DNA--protein-cysteine methyltransferase
MAFGPRGAAGLEEVARQLGLFFDGTVVPSGLLLKVGAARPTTGWELIVGVPCGATPDGELVGRLGGMDPRDVGTAAGRDLLCIIICGHRVAGAAGRRCGRAG